MTVMRLFRLGIPHLPATQACPIQDCTGSQMPPVDPLQPSQSVVSRNRLHFVEEGKSSPKRYCQKVWMGRRADIEGDPASSPRYCPVLTWISSFREPVSSSVSSTFPTPAA